MNTPFITRFLKSSIITTGGTFLTLTAQFFAITLLARTVPEQTLGLYFLVLAVALALKIFANLGLDLTLVKFLADEKTAVKKDIVNVILLTRIVVLIFVSLLVFLLGRFALPLLGDGLEQYLLFIPFIFAGHSLRELLYYLLQGNQQFKEMAGVRVVTAVFKLTLYILFRQNLTLNTLLIIELVVVGSGILLQMVLIPFRQLGLFGNRFDRETLRRALKFGFPLYLSSLVDSVGGDSAIFVINYFLNPIGIAFYEIAEKLPEGVDDLLSSFDTVYYPSISTLFAEGNADDAVRMMNKSATLMSSLMSLICVGAFVFGEPIITLLFSERYASVSFGMTLSMVAVAFGIVANIFGYTLVSANQPQTSTITNTVTVLLFIVGAFVLVPPLGFVGAIAAGVIANLLDVLIYALFLRRYQLTPRLWRILQPLLLGFLFCVAFWLISPSSWFIQLLLTSSFAFLLAGLIEDVRKLRNYLPFVSEKIRNRLQHVFS